MKMLLFAIYKKYKNFSQSSKIGAMAVAGIVAVGIGLWIYSKNKQK